MRRGLLKLYPVSESGTHGDRGLREICFLGLEVFRGSWLGPHQSKFFQSLEIYTRALTCHLRRGTPDSAQGFRPKSILFPTLFSSTVPLTPITGLTSGLTMPQLPID